jgi:D-alanine-D-alanine ligase
MKIALTHNLKRADVPEQSEFDDPELIEALLAGMQKSGHEAVPVEVTCSLAEVAQKLSAVRPDLIFNFAAGIRGKLRAAVFPALFEELGIPYTGPDGWTLCVTLDKKLAKTLVQQAGVPVTRDVLARAGDSLSDIAAACPLPCLIKPCYLSGSVGISDKSVVSRAELLRPALESAVAAWPEGVLIEEYIPGTDVTVPYIAGLGPEVLTPCSYEIEAGHLGQYRLYDYQLKHHLSHAVTMRCPAEVPEPLQEKIRDYARLCVRHLQLRDFSRIDFRVRDDGQIFFIEANATPTLPPGGGMFIAAERHGYSFDDVMKTILAQAARRWGIPGAAGRSSAAASPRPRA